MSGRKRPKKRLADQYTKPIILRLPMFEISVSRELEGLILQTQAALKEAIETNKQVRERLEKLAQLAKG